MNEGDWTTYLVEFRAEMKDVGRSEAQLEQEILEQLTQAMNSALRALPEPLSGRGVQDGIFVDARARLESVKLVYKSKK